MEINKKNFGLFWYWINERHRVYLKKTAGEPKPWSKDPIFQEYKFTNVFRELDTGTIWLRKNFIEPQWWDSDMSLLLFNIVWYRMFNWTGTGELLGFQTTWDVEAITEKLKTASYNGKQVFTGAHIIRSEAGMGKIESIVKAIRPVYEERQFLTNEIKRLGTLEAAHNLFLKYRLIGHFLAYEIVTDLRHTPLLNNAKDINTWCNIGPGAKRGLDRIFKDGYSWNYLDYAKWLLDASPRLLEPHVPKLELRDIEHSLCEFSKMAKVYYKEGRTRSKYNGAA